MQYQKIKLQEDYQTACVVFTHGLCAVFAICLMTGACVGLKSAETILTNPGPHTSEGVCSDTEDAGEIKAECEASGVLGGEKQTWDDHSILRHWNVGIEEGYVYRLGMTRASCALERGG